MKPNGWTILRQEDRSDAEYIKLTTASSSLVIAVFPFTVGTARKKKLDHALPFTISTKRSGRTIESNTIMFSFPDGIKATEFRLRITNAPSVRWKED